MRDRRALAAGGAVAVLVYVLAVLASGGGGLLYRRPLLDGLSGPPPYRWVDPPAALKVTNQKPSSATTTVDLDPTGGSAAAVVVTDDGQATMALNQGTIPPASDQTQATVTITPLAATGLGPPPKGQEIAGNVYRIVAAYGDGSPVTTVGASGAQVVLEYPATAGELFDHVLLISPDGRTWRTLAVADARGQRLVQADVRLFGYFAVGQSGGRAQHGGIGSLIPWLVLAVVVALLIVVFVRAELRRRGRPAGSSASPSSS